MAYDRRTIDGWGRLQNMVTAIVLIDVEADRIPEAAQHIADLPGVDQVYSCAGDVDLVAITRVADHEAIADLVPGHISKVPGVLRTVTHIAFREYSQRGRGRRVLDRHAGLNPPSGPRDVATANEPVANRCSAPRADSAMRRPIQQRGDRRSAGGQPLALRHPTIQRCGSGPTVQRGCRLLHTGP